MIITFYNKQWEKKGIFGIISNSIYEVWWLWGKTIDILFRVLWYLIIYFGQGRGSSKSTQTVNANMNMTLKLVFGP